jgi:hypothetical protein
VRSAFFAASWLTVVAVGCSEMKPGYCEKSSDCRAGQTCQLDWPLKFQCVSSVGPVPDGAVAMDRPSDLATDTDPGGECSMTRVCPSERPTCLGGKCVECIQPSECKDPTRAFCVGNMCTGCGGAGAGACTAPAKICDSDSGRCLECKTSADCTMDSTKPICAAGKCGPCSTDGDCASRQGPNPGVCMAHQDGRCATDGETIYVQAGGACAAGTGSAALPLCDPQDAEAILALGLRRLVVVRGAVPGFSWTLSGPQVSVVGQMGATVAGGANVGLRVNGGDLYGRGFSVTGGVGVNAVGVIAQANSTLRLDTVTVTANQGGGILLDGARFEIRKTTIVGNGPGQTGAVSWGGILVQSSPPGGLAHIENVTVKDNKAPGLTCTAAIQGSGVLAQGNSTIDIAPTCMVTACSPAGPTCGAP